MTDGAAWAVFSGFAAAFGLVIGSFLNVVILRGPAEHSLLVPSHCPSCGHRVRPRDLVPVLSWLLLRGRCRDCGQPISAQYPLVELLTGLLAWLAFVRFVPDVHAIDAPHLAAWAVYAAFLADLVVVVFVDLRHRLILDATSIYAIPIGVAAAVLLTSVGYEGVIAVGWREAVLGALAGGAFFGLLAVSVWVVARTEGLGWGDVKLMAMIGAFLGPAPGGFTALLVGSILGSAFGIAAMVMTRRRGTLPMGPPLALGATVYVLFGPELLARVLPGIADLGDMLGWALGT